MGPDDLSLGVEKEDAGQTQGDQGAFIEIRLDERRRLPLHERHGIIPQGPIHHGVVKFLQFVPDGVFRPRHVLGHIALFKVDEILIEQIMLQGKKTEKKNNDAQANAEQGHFSYRKPHKRSLSPAAAGWSPPAHRDLKDRHPSRGKSPLAPTASPGQRPLRQSRLIGKRSVGPQRCHRRRRQTRRPSLRGVPLGKGFAGSPVHGGCPEGEPGSIGQTTARWHTR